MATTTDRAKMWVSGSKKTRRGPSNPNRQRQPVRLGTVKPSGVTAPLKGPDKGMG